MFSTSRRGADPQDRHRLSFPSKFARALLVAVAIPLSASLSFAQGAPPPPGPNTLGHPSNSGALTKICDAIDSLKAWKSHVESTGEVDADGNPMSEEADDRITAAERTKKEWEIEVLPPNILGWTTPESERPANPGSSFGAYRHYGPTPAAGNQKTSIASDLANNSSFRGLSPALSNVIRAAVTGHEGARRRQTLCTFGGARVIRRANGDNHGAYPTTPVGFAALHDEKDIHSNLAKILEADVSYYNFILQTNTAQGHGLSATDVTWLENFRNDQAQSAADARARVSSACQELRNRGVNV